MTVYLSLTISHRHGQHHWPLTWSLFFQYLMLRCPLVEAWVSWNRHRDEALATHLSTILLTLLTLEVTTHELLFHLSGYFNLDWADFSLA